MAVTIAETGGHVAETVLKSPLSPPVTMRRNDRSHSPKYAPNPVPSELLSVLSARESEVLKQVARGYADQELAARLNIALSTVDTLVRAIYRTLSVNSRSQLRRVLEP